MGEGGKEGSLFSEDNGPRDSLWHGVEEDIVRVLSLYDKRCSPFFSFLVPLWMQASCRQRFYYEVSLSPVQPSSVYSQQ